MTYGCPTLSMQVFTELKGLEMQIFEYKERERAQRSQISSVEEASEDKTNLIAQLRYALEDRTVDTLFAAN